MTLRDFESLANKYIELKEENQALKKQLEEKNILIKQCELSVSNVMDCYCERTDCSGRIKDSKKYDSLVQKVETQQKAFINYLEDERKRFLSNFNTDGIPIIEVELLDVVLKNYKKIMGLKKWKKK